MKRLVMMALAAVLLPTAALAAPDFNGAWVRDAKASTPDPYPLYWLTRSAPEGGGGNNNQYVLDIKQDKKAVLVTSPNEPLRTYALDGKAHTVPTDTGLATASVTASMSKTALMVSSSEPWGGMPGNAVTSVKDSWTLSPDGKVLTVTRVRSAPSGDQTFKEVYNKK